MTVLWRRNRGVDPFTSHSLGTTGSPQSIAAAELTADPANLRDHAVGIYNGAVRVLKNLGSRNVAAAGLIAVVNPATAHPEGAQDVEAVNIGGDAFPDLATGNDVDASVSVLIITIAP